MMKLRNITITLSTFGVVHLLLWWQPVFSGVVKGGTGTITSALGANPVTKRSANQGKRSALELFDAFTRLGFSPIDLARRQAVMRELCAVDAAAACDAFETLPRALREGVCRDFCKMIAEVNPGAADVIFRRLSGMPKDLQTELIFPLCMWHPEIIDDIGAELYQYHGAFSSPEKIDSRIPLQSLLGLVGRPGGHGSAWSISHVLRRSGEWSAGELEAARDESTVPKIKEILNLALAVKDGDSSPQSFELPALNGVQSSAFFEFIDSPQIDSWEVSSILRDKKNSDTSLLHIALSMGIADSRWQEFGIGLLQNTAQEGSGIEPDQVDYLTRSIVVSGVDRGGLPVEDLAEIVLSLPEGGVKDHGIEALVSAWVDKDPAAASAFVAEHPETEGRNLNSFYRKLAENSLDSPAEAAALALMLPDHVAIGSKRSKRDLLISQIRYSADIQGIDPMNLIREVEAETGLAFLESERARLSGEVAR